MDPFSGKGNRSAVYNADLEIDKRPLRQVRQFAEEIHQFEEERRMRYVTSVERFAMQRRRAEGRQKGLLEAAALLLESKFGAAG